MSENLIGSQRRPIKRHFRHVATPELMNVPIVVSSANDEGSGLVLHVVAIRPTDILSITVEGDA